MKAIFVLMTLAAMTQVQASQTQRWYQESQVTSGEKLYQQYCSSCHQADGSGTRDWKTRDAAGNLPPPPLNGSAHAWHHDIATLAEQIRAGGEPLGGTMPAFGKILNEAQIESLVAFIHSLWPEELYQRWAGNFLTTAASDDLPAFSQPDPAQQVTSYLQRRIGRTLEPAKATAVDNLWQTRLQGQNIYLLNDGRYAVIGKLIDLQSGQNLTENYNRKENLKILSGLDPDDMLVYAPHQPKAVMTVFTDTSCPYCRKLHSELPQLLEAGITLRYLPFPRGGDQGPGYLDLKKVWCSADRKAALDQAKAHNGEASGKAECQAAAAVDRGYAIGTELGVTGTPALYLQNGQQIEGYVPADKLIPMVLQAAGAKS